jgi:hypothetical protein
MRRSICQGSAQDPYQTNCMRLFCRSPGVLNAELNWTLVSAQPDLFAELWGEWVGLIRPGQRLIDRTEQWELADRAVRHGESSYIAGIAC